MGLLEKLNKDLLLAMKGKDSVTADTIRSVKTAIKTAQVLKKTTVDLEDSEIIQIIQKQAKQRQDAIELFNKGSREDLAEKEMVELRILETYLPQEATSNKINEVLDTLTITNMGETIKHVKELLMNEGLMVDGKLLSNLVRERLNK